MKSAVVFPFEQAGWPALLVDAAGVVQRANPCARDLFGAALAGDAPLLAAIWSPENATTLDKFLGYAALAAAPVVGLKFRLPGGPSRKYSVTVCGFPEPAEKLFLLQLLPPTPAGMPDTVLANGETGSWQKQKLDCALQLARTVSLDFNNALTSILGHTSLVLTKMEAGHPWRHSLLEVEKSAGRAAEIANDLGTFSRQEKEVRSQAAGNLNQVLQHSVEFFQKNSGADPVKWTLQFERKLFTARFDEAKLQQAFVKIIENALQAIKDNGRISVQTRNLELTESSQDREVRLAAGAYVCAEISDNGSGIAPEVLPRVFEPFFTTKGGEHRGLGLAWVYGIVTNLGGGVAVSSVPGAGASVRVYLPAEKRLVRDNTIAPGDLSGHQTILFVDDEDLLLTMGQTILTAYGYHVLTSSSGQRAIEILSRGDPAVDLIITDLVMPVMGGRELVEHVQRIAPGIPIICTSGYAWPAAQYDERSYLQKPFTSQELLLKIKSALAAGEG